MSNNNIQMNISGRQKFTINGDESKFIMLNPGDMGIVARLGDAIPVLNGFAEQYDALMRTSLGDDETEKSTEESMIEFNKKFTEIDNQLRDTINNLFNYDVCSVCADGGSMLDLQDGEYRFSVIIEALMPIYEETISAEMEKLVKKMNKRVEKYTTQDHKKRQRK